MPPQQPRRRAPPLLLDLDHEQQAGDDEARPADDLWQPVDPVGGGGGEGAVDGGQGGKAGDPEDGGAEELGEAGEEAEGGEVGGFERGEGGEEGEFKLLRGGSFGVGGGRGRVGGEGCSGLTWGVLSDPVGFVRVVVVAFLGEGAETEAVVFYGLFECPAEALGV